MSTSQRDEPLRDLALVHALRTAGWSAQGVRLRSGVVDRLTVAQTLLPRALRFLVVAGHHNGTGTCPHTAAHATGGALDLTLYVSGLPEPAVWDDTPPPEWPVAIDALMAIGMVNHGPWWHWSFGDAQWCASTGAPAPLYGPIA